MDSAMFSDGYNCLTQSLDNYNYHYTFFDKYYVIIPLLDFK